jgi:hypothetical protein
MTRKSKAKAAVAVMRSKAARSTRGSVEREQPTPPAYRGESTVKSVKPKARKRRTK